MEAVLKNSNVIWINGSNYGYKTSPRYDFVPIPEQDVSSLFEWVGDPIEGSWNFIGTNDDIIWEFPSSGLPTSIHPAKLMAVNVGNAKPAIVRRWYLGQPYDVSCLVTQGVKDDYQANKIEIGDWMLVKFFDENPETHERDVAIVTDKVFKSW